MESIFSELPEDLRRAALEHYARPSMTKQGLTAALVRYQDVIAEAARQRSDLDVNLADCIARSCQTLLNEHWDQATVNEQRLIQTACDYFIDSDDEDGDLDSVFGFDDDAQLINVVVAHFERSDLSILI